MQRIREQAEAMVAKNKKTAAPADKKAAVTAEEDKKFADIQNNTFYKIMTDANTSPEEKQKALSQAMTFDKTEDKARSLERLKELKLFKDYVQTQRREMAKEIINLTDPRTFAQLKNVYDRLNGALLQFDEDLKPLQEILDAFYELRMAGKDEATGVDLSVAVFKEIKDGLKAEADRRKELATESERLTSLQSGLDGKDMEIARLSEQKAFFGLGGIKSSARQRIAEIQVEKQRIERESADLAAKVEQLSKPTEQETKYAAFAEQKKRIMAMMDISEEGHIERNQKLIDTAIAFIERTTEEVNGVREYYTGVEGQTQRLVDGNARMQGVYAILADATKDAAHANKAIHTEFATTPADEDAVAKLKREETLRGVNEYVKAMDFEAVDTLQSFRDLSEEAVRVGAMKDMCQQSIADIDKLATTGVASVASGLATVVTGIAQTALNESYQVANGTINAMRDKTATLTAQGSISAALGIGTIVEDFNRSVAGATDMKEGLDLATKIRSDSLRNLRDMQVKMEETINALRESTKAAESVHAEIDMQAAVGTTAPANDDKTSNSGAGKPAAGVSAFKI